MTSVSKDIGHVADRLAIQDLQYRWCRAIDRLDWALAREVFHTDAIIHGPRKVTVDEMVSWLQKRHSGISQSMHNATNILIDFTGPDEAVTETYIVTYQRYLDGEDKEARIAMMGEEVGSQRGVIDMNSAVRYVDVVERRLGDWRIKHRTVVFEFVFSNVVKEFPAINKTHGINPNWITQKRGDQKDFIYERLRDRTVTGSSNTSRTSKAG